MKRLGSLFQRARKKKFVRDTLILQVSTVVQNGTYFVTSVLTAKLLGLEQLGRWTTSRELYTFVFFMVSMGLTNAAISMYSRAHGADDDSARVNAIAALLKLGAVVTALLLAAAVFVMPWAGEYFYRDRTIGLVTSVLCFSVAGEILRALAMAVLGGSRQMKRYALFDMTTNVLRVGLVASALAISPTPMAVGVAYLAHGFTSGLLALRAYAQVRADGDPRLAPPPLRRVLAAVPSAPLREFFGLAFLLSLSKAMNTLVPRLAPLLIPILGVSTISQGMEANGAYSVGLVLTMVLTGGVGAIAQNVLPTMGQKMGESDVTLLELAPLFRRLSLMAGAISMGTTLLSVPIMWFVVTYAYGAEFAEAFEYYLLLATGNLFIGFAVIVEPFYIYAKRLGHHVAQSLVYSVLAVAGIASATTAFGPKGAALAAGLCKLFVLCHLVYIWVYFRRARARRDTLPTESDDSLADPT